MTYRTTAAHFAIFKAECERRIKQYRIVGWRVDYLHDKCEGSRAECRSDARNQVAVLALSTEWGDQVAATPELVRQAARHEVIHLILDHLTECAAFRWVTQDQYKHALERTVRHLEDILP